MSSLEEAVALVNKCDAIPDCLPRTEVAKCTGTSFDTAMREDPARVVEVLRAYLVRWELSRP